MILVIRSAAPKLRIAIHVHNTFGLGVGLCVAAVQAGADVVELSLNGTGPASGQVDLAQVAAALEILYGVKTGINLERLTGLRRVWEFDLNRILLHVQNSTAVD